MEVKIASQITSELAELKAGFETNRIMTNNGETLIFKRKRLIMIAHPEIDDKNLARTKKVGSSNLIGRSENCHYELTLMQHLFQRLNWS